MKNVTSLLMTLLLVVSLPLFTSCGSGSGSSNLQIPGVTGPKIVLTNDNVLISMVFQQVAIDGGLRYNIPKYQQSYVEISPDFESGGTLMAFSISLQDVFHGNLTQLDPQKLPGGRNLPGVTSGQLPAVAFSIEKFNNVTVYLGPKVFGIFVAIPKLGVQNSIVTARYYVSGTRMGNLSLVGQDENGKNGGMLLLLDLNSTVTSRLSKIADKYAN